MPKKAKSKRRRSAFSAKPKLPLKQRILRRAFRALPFMMNGFFVVTALTILAAVGTIGWQAFAQSGGGGEDPPPTRTVEYKYDDHGMLVGRLVKDGAGEVIEDRRFLVDYHNITGYPQFLAEINYKTQTPFKENVWGPDGLLSQTEWINGNEYVVRYPMADAQGTVRAVQHEYHGGPKNGTTEVTYHDYSPFGELLSDPPAVGYAFHGQWRDPDTGMQFHISRWYDPNTGRWTGPDPSFDFPNNFGNAYAYAGQNPVNASDKAGRFTMLEAQVVQSIVSELVQQNMETGTGALQDAAGTVVVADNREFMNDVVGMLMTAQTINRGMQYASAGIAIGGVLKAGLTKAGRMTLGSLRRTFGKPKNWDEIHTMIQPATRRRLGEFFNAEIPLKRIHGKAYRSAPHDAPSFEADFISPPTFDARFKPKSGGAGYFALDSAETSAFELAAHNYSQIQVSAVQVQYDNILDLTDPDVWGKLDSSTQQKLLGTGSDYGFTREFAESLKSQDVKGIIYPSVRNPSGVNLVVFERGSAHFTGNAVNIDISSLR